MGNALEVTSSETYYVPVRLRGNLYLVSLTQTSFSYDEGREEAEEERETFFPKVSTFDGDDGDLGIVTFFDDDGVSAAALLKEEEEAEGGGGLAAASQKSGAGDRSDEEDPIDFVEEEDVEEDVEEEVEQEQEEKMLSKKALMSTCTGFSSRLTYWLSLTALFPWTVF